MARVRAGSRGVAALAAALLLAGCAGEGTGPSDRRVELHVFAGGEQFGLPAQALTDPLEVVVLDAASRAPVEKVAVEWRLVAGGGGSITVIDAESDEFGIARASFRLGADTGTYVIEATAQRRTNAAPRFEVRGIRAPQLDANAGVLAAAGSTIELAGSGFHADPSRNVVRFGGVRGEVLGGSASVLTVRVPGCVADRRVAVLVEIGGVRSNTIVLDGRGPAGPAAERLGVGEARRYATAAELACLRLAGDAGAEYLVLVQHAADRATPRSPFELVGFIDPLVPVTALSEPAVAAADDRASTFELSLRTQETGWVDAAPPPGDRVAAAIAATTNVPAIGARSEFKVLKADRTFGSVTAEVRHVSEHAILYQDIRAPAGGFAAREFEQLAALFDDPIHATTIGVFGQPSDIDANGRIIILFTPAVNELTQPHDQGFIAGYFYGCDLLDRQRCSGSNRAEIFYSMVPDPNGTFGRRHSASDVLRSVPAVLAHEFQHMIHFAQKGSSLDALWLSEGLAHAAEDVVADVLEARGRHTTAAEFRSSNFLRGRYFVQSPGHNGLLAEAVPGTLAMRGGAWLLMKYVMGHHGGAAVLGALTRASQNGAANVVARTDRSWPELLADFALALYADGTSIPVAARHTFPNFAPRSALVSSGAYPLAVQSLSAGSFARTMQLGGSGSEYLLVRVPTTGGAPVHLTLSGLRGGAFAHGVQPQLTVLRTR